MINWMLQVNIIPVEDNFVHLSSKLIRELNAQRHHNHTVCLKVTAIDGVQQEFYASYCQTPCNANGADAFNISYELSTTIGLIASQYVLISLIDQVYTLERVFVTPVTNADWDLLMLNNVSLQDRILQQLQIVHKNRIFPIWVSKFVHLKICIDDLENGLQVGSLKDSTEIVVKPNVMESDRSINIDQNADESVPTDAINQNYCIPITKYHNRFIYRTILVEKTLLESDYIYDYCVLVSKAHMSIIFKNNEAYSNKNSFVKISLIHEFDRIKSEDSKNKSTIKNPSIIVRLCPLDPSMNNIKKMEVITWPTIYVTNVLSKILGLKMNSKVILEPVSQIENEICDVQNIHISPSNNIKIVGEEKLVECTLKRLKDEIILREVLVLNNSSLLRVVYNKISAIDVLVTFSPSHIPFVLLNEFNFGMITFTSKTDKNYHSNHVNSIKITDPKPILESLLSNIPKPEHYDLKCFKQMNHTGSLCLKSGLQCYTTLSHTFFAFDNLLITGSIASGKTSAAKLFCNKLSKCPYFVKIIWINGRFLAGKLWETVQKQITSDFQECLYFQPAIIVIDDFDDLCHLNSEPNEHADMSKIYLRNQYCIRVVCTAKPLNQENENLFSKQFKHVFRTVIHIPPIDKESRKIIISKRLKKVNFNKDVDYDFLMSICDKMDNYVIQDIIDYCDKVLFEIFKGGCNTTLNKTVLTDVIEKSVPLSLHNVKLFKEKNINFSLVGGLKEAKQSIIETIIWPSLHSDIFSNCPIKLQSGVLLYGAPGTGKTLLARAIVGESGLNFISVNGPELLSKYVGESEESVRKVFQRAQNAKPCIIFFDEFESIAPNRGSDQTGVTDRVVNQFLTQLDGVDIFEGVWVIAATSRPDLIDQALLRPGRIGVKLHCPIPTMSDREDILRVLCNKVTLSNDVDLHNIATETNNYTGADLNGLLYTTLSIAEKKFLKDQDCASSLDPDGVSQLSITNDDFQEALKSTKPSLHQSDIDRYAEIHRIFAGKRIYGRGNIAEVHNNNRRQQKSTFA
ncbi:PREDICTED: peroxisome biogenesis factor 1 isoform X2 [Diuraphis noxia]|uniref:peroxisome biogenesis factor 1 isoform X2 n=1 Tax=Diuraphis noxia TaxID=143948 RepID=UPI0007636B51|nr:PREDICTED: peroxisome biogenesis factor 1 isoform X2 [Diuraphis noxia]